MSDTPFDTNAFIRTSVKLISNKIAVDMLAKSMKFEKNFMHEYGLDQAIAWPLTDYIINLAESKLFPPEE